MNNAIVSLIIQAYHSGLLQNDQVLLVWGYTVSLKLNTRFNVMTIASSGRSVNTTLWDTDTTEQQETDIANLFEMVRI